MMDNKETIILNLLKTGSLNRFEAERHGDHCLNSTVSILRNKKGYNILSIRERVPNRFGGTTSVNRYFIPPEPQKATEKNPIAL